MKYGREKNAKQNMSNIDIDEVAVCVVKKSKTVSSLVRAMNNIRHMRRSILLVSDLLIVWIKISPHASSRFVNCVDKKFTTCILQPRSPPLRFSQGHFPLCPLSKPLKAVTKDCYL